MSSSLSKEKCPLAVVDKVEYKRQEILRQQLRADDHDVEQRQQRYDV